MLGDPLPGLKISLKNWCESPTLVGIVSAVVDRVVDKIAGDAATIGTTIHCDVIAVS